MGLGCGEIGLTAVAVGNLIGSLCAASLSALPATSDAFNLITA